MAITVPAAGDDILASWGELVSDWLNDHTAITASSATIDASPEVAVHSLTLAANDLAVGDTFKITAYGTVTSNGANVITFRIRCGPTTLTGDILAAVTPTATATAAGDAFSLTGLVTFRVIGASGDAFGGITIIGSNAEPFANPTRVGVGSDTTIDTTAALLLELTCVTAANGTTVVFTLASIERVSAP